MPDTASVTLCSATLGEDGVREPPLGPLYIAAAFGEMGVDVDFRDFQLEERANGFSGDALVEYLDGHADLVAISCFVDMLPAVVDAARQLHEARPDTVVLLGGPGPTASAARLLEEYPWISGVVRGEGEETTQEWVRLLRGEVEGPVAGLVYRGRDGIVDGGERPRNRELDDLPLPAYHLLDPNQYTHGRIITTRGCSYRCSFCDVTALWGNRSVYRGLGATIDEMELVGDLFGDQGVSIVDDTFVLNRNRVREFCRLLLERDVGLPWGCFGRINLMTPDLVELMAAAGCKAVFYGIDSGSQPVLDRTAKKLRAEDVVPVLELSARYFRVIEASFIWGYPFETLDDFDRTLQLAAEASMLGSVVNVQLHMLSPLPLSPIYREFDGELIEPEHADKQWLLLPALLLDDRASRMRELVRAAPDIYPGFYAFPTPSKQEKRQRLGDAMHTLQRIVGSTLVDSRVARLAEDEHPELEQSLLAAANGVTERVGTGLALGYFRRARSNALNARPAKGVRGPRMVRERDDLRQVAS
jgi:anaerobic magnesium-protoporphyrin IX monomethyl ester cyclase